MEDVVDLTGVGDTPANFPSLAHLEDVVIEISSESEVNTPVKPDPKKVKEEEQEIAVKRKLFPQCENPADDHALKATRIQPEEEIEYYNEDKRLPIFMKHDRTYRFTVERLGAILLDRNFDSDFVCKAQPTRVSHNVAFVVDCSYLADRKDLLVDDLGVWTSKGSRKTPFSATISSNNVSIRVRSDEHNNYLMHRAWHTHGTSDDVRRLVVSIEDQSGQLLDLAMVIYTFTKGNEHEIMVRPHGNSRSGHPYQRTLPSTLKLLKETKHKPAKAAVSAVAKQRGGLLGARSAGELPRNQKQVYNARQQKTAQGSLVSAKGESDVLYYLMEQSRKCHGEVQFVRDVKAVPEPMCVLATDLQLDDMVRFCTCPGNFSVLCIDPTFCIGEFNVTPIVYQHKLLETCRSSNHPIVHGPILVHQKKEFASYHYFLSTLIGLRPNLKAVRAFGTDGEETLVQALKSSFPYAQQLRCFLHMRRNIKNKLNEFHVTSASISVVIADIFGMNDGTTFHEGLVDASDDEDFFLKLEGMEKKWGELEQKDSKQQPKFFNWFEKYESRAFVDAMIKPRRELAGLGSPAAEFTTNACESGHAALKSYLPKRNKCSWQEFVQKSLEFVEDQRREVEMAVLNRGQYRFMRQYSSDLVVGEKWFVLNEGQQAAHLRKVHTHKLGFNLGSPGSVHESASTSASSDIGVSSPESPNPTAGGLSDETSDSPVESNFGATPVPILAVSSTEFASRVELSDATVQAIWQKAEVLLKTKGSIVLAPGMPTSWYVESKSKQAPHLVRVSPKGIISCDKVCEHFRSISICSHTVAIAQKRGSLVAFVNSFVKKKGKLSPNLGNFALTGMPAGRSRKGAAPPRKRLPKTASSLLPHTPLVVRNQETSSASPESRSSLPRATSPGCLLGREFSPPPSVEEPSTSGSFEDALLSYDMSASGHQMYDSPLLGAPMHPPGPFYFQPNYGSSSYQQSYSPGASPYAPIPSPAMPQMQPADPDSPFVLKMLNHMLKVCAGCRGGYTKKANGALPDPPFDICVSHEIFITLTNPVKKTPFQKKTKSHYHANPSCIVLKHPTFNPSSLVVPPELAPKLTRQHWEYLHFYFGIAPKY